MTERPDRDLREGPLPQDAGIAGSSEEAATLEETPETVGTADAEADRARSGVDVDPSALTERAEPGGAVGTDDRDADVVASGGDPDRA